MTRRKTRDLEFPQEESSKYKGGWYTKRTTMGMIFLALSLLTGLGISRLTFGPAEGPDGSRRISVIIEHFGNGSREIEETITVPLEEALQPLKGIQRIQGISTRGRCRIDCTLENDAAYPETYAAVRASVEQVYAVLPSSVQKPRIITGSSSRRPVCILAVRPTANGTEDFKKRIEGIQGVGEVETGGRTEKEVHIIADMEKASAYSLTASELGQILSSELLTEPAGIIESEGFRIPITAAGSGTGLREIGKLPVPLSAGNSVPLSSISTLLYGEKKAESVSRVNGEMRTVAYVQGDGTVNIVALSGNIREAVEEMNKDGSFETEILFDAGESVKKALFQILRALGMGTAAVAVTLILFGGTVRQLAATIFFLPFSILSGAAVLTALGFGVDKYVLAGFALATGMVVDIDILISEYINALPPGVLQPLRRLLPPVFSSTITTAAVLLPFLAAPALASGAGQISLAVSVTLILNLFFSSLFLPPLLITAKRSVLFTLRSCLFPSGVAAKKILRPVYFTYKKLSSIRSFRLWVMLGAVALSGLAVIRMGTDLSPPPPENLLYSRIEFKSGTSLEAVDRRLTMLAAGFRRIPGIEQVETLAKRGSGVLTARYNPEVIVHRDASTALRRTAENIPECFAYIADPKGSRERKIGITLYGPDHETLRKTARTAASKLVKGPFIHETVLHFKAGVPVYQFEINRIKTANAGVLPAQISRTLRWNIHAPVACKWAGPGGEKDLRIVADYSSSGHHDQRRQRLSLNDLDTIQIPIGEEESANIGRFGRFYTVEEPGILYRENRQKVIYMTVHAEGRNIEQTAEKLWNILDSVPLPEGCGFQIDRKIFDHKEQIRKLLFFAAIAAFLVYMILAIQFESFLLPCIVVSTIPLTLVLPLTALWISGKCITVPILIGCIVLLGSSVNNAILITDRFTARSGGTHFGPVLALRKRLRSLVIASSTTIIGAFPLFFMTRGTSRFLSELAFTVFFGTIGSVAVSCFLFPAFLSQSSCRSSWRRRRFKGAGRS